ncbi:hypothetical protein RRG08_014496 [Elysia crispata]|uniref:Uncharacterized protein n=1 Tax=Elysia crispata TaxID=231223 RepID=A0AAE1AUZ9_9GAST|nr:hypothetical protein RRG08_014496 [Elysia crispata]
MFDIRGLELLSGYNHIIEDFEEGFLVWREIIDIFKEILSFTNIRFAYREDLELTPRANLVDPRPISAWDYHVCRQHQPGQASDRPRTGLASL